MENIIEKLIDFRDARNWAHYHTTPNLAQALSIEAAELQELFLWGWNEPTRERIAEELADVLIYALYIAYNEGFDIEEIILDKIKKNAVKYPAPTV
jgi:NTP pyrophosphatase (non-canonical NTP hydrolase)